MDQTELTYPVFEANQVLTNAHLNDLFEYLDEQTRLTRSNLIGIGIACGLEVTFEAPGTVHLSKGCGVTSQGYLIVEPADLDRHDLFDVELVDRIVGQVSFPLSAATRNRRRHPGPSSPGPPSATRSGHPPRSREAATRQVPRGSSRRAGRTPSQARHR